MTKQICLLLVLFFSNLISAQDVKNTKWLPELHGTIRGKYEYQPNTEDPHRFQVRNARFSLSGYVTPIVYYKAEMDLSDKGKQRMLDAFTRIKPTSNFDFSIGQMRVPFTLDAPRSPHKRYFANRSFIAKQIGSVRDVGTILSFQVHAPFFMEFNGGLFNGTGLDREAQEQWHSTLSYVVQSKLFFNHNSNIILGMLSTCPEKVRMYMFNIGGYYKWNNFHLEVEYVKKNYEKNLFHNVESLNSMLLYNWQIKKKNLQTISFLSRYDIMGNNSEGAIDEKGDLIISDIKRQRFTTGITFSLSAPFTADIRINYEKYFYDKGALIGESDKDKFVIEFMTRF